MGILNKPCYNLEKLYGFFSKDAFRYINRNQNTDEGILTTSQKLHTKESLRSLNIDVVQIFPKVTIYYIAEKSSPLH